MNKAELTNEDIVVLNSLMIELGNNVNSFIYNWFCIMNVIRNKIHSTADIYTNNLYNPFKPEEPLYDFADLFIQGINDGIYNEYCKKTYKYQVADVYNKFIKYNNDNKNDKLLVHDLNGNDPDACYLHPTDTGYKFIFDLHKDLLNNVK
jgi:hypothetical protein